MYLSDFVYSLIEWRQKQLRNSDRRFEPGMGYRMLHVLDSAAAHLPKLLLLSHHQWKQSQYDSGIKVLHFSFFKIRLWFDQKHQLYFTEVLNWSRVYERSRWKFKPSVRRKSYRKLSKRWIALRPINRNCSQPYRRRSNTIKVCA